MSDNYNKVIKETRERLGAALRLINDALELDNITYIEKEALNEASEQIGDIIDSLTADPTASTTRKACNTECEAYALGACRYVDKRACPRYKAVYKI